ncbi:MDR family NADP-dependent oxidoreductase [Shewanella sp. OMA3-2]|uniref:MDR family NADP-dependent oxidoreductase n=1 Tax=Shewanella sp. OMA3-2 TaxID=2908650 RepID=UPI001F4595B5|nr:NADP-dependent oxidoreductase [Shewanella sp. OMA3-2]UJF20831.1 NADP-dependent oxidoreductase [Shewanella sp. OMA3-2]
MKKNTQVRLKSTPEGEPCVSNFSLTESTIPVLSDKQVLCKTRYLSLDPYMRSQISGRHISGAIKPGDMLLGETISEVVESLDEHYKVGDKVRCMGGWQEYSVHSAKELTKVCDKITPSSYALSVLGMPGLTAYAGLVWQAKPKAGDVVVIPAATGAVGSTAGQLAKSFGCKVIGIAGSDEKCAYAKQQLGYDECINRRTEDIANRLDELCPKGVDIYFDLVGGEILNTVSARLAIGARVILCGLMAEYNQKERIGGPSPRTVDTLARHGIRLSGI